MRKWLPYAKGEVFFNPIKVEKLKSCNVEKFKVPELKGGEVQEELAERKVEEWLMGVTRVSFFRLCERGDYGRLDLLDRCGIQLYVRWPKGYQPMLKLDCLTNVFLETMICLTGDTSLVRFESEGASLPIQAPLKAPAGTIKRGIIQNGRDKGKGLFD